MATPKQALWAHIQEMHSRHSQPGRADPARTMPHWTIPYRELQLWHAKQHHQYSPNHHHGPNPGPNDRPPGWYTGLDAEPIAPRKGY